MKQILKIKILKILPLWLSGLLILLAIQIGGILITAAPIAGQTAQAETSTPQVLGASTTVRGDSSDQNPLEQIGLPDVSQITAKSFLVFDLSSGQILLSKNPDQKLQIASLTKLITGLVAYQNLNLNTPFTIAQNDILNVKPNLDFQVGDSVAPLDVFNAMLIGSCNDAALALADFTSRATGLDFIKLMNNEAQNLGMENSSFSNPMGFDSSDNYSTADDLKLLIAATQKISAFTDLGRRTDYQFSGSDGISYSTVATNALIKTHPDIQAIKTGYTQGAAGAMATKINVSGHQIAILVLDSQDREGDTLRLKDQVMADYK